MGNFKGLRTPRALDDGMGSAAGPERPLSVWSGPSSDDMPEKDQSEDQY